jgi:FMN phosphatase YigB (HAD superfamily)
LEKFPEIHKIFKKELIVVSCYEKQAKPNKNFYETLLRKIDECYPGVETSQVAFIDDKKLNVTASRELGIYGIHFHSGKNDLKVLKEELEKFGINFE